MNNKYDQKEESVIEGAFRLRDEGRRLSHIIEKFPDYRSEVREIFGIVAFIKENEDKVSAPKNILKTLLSKLPDNFKIQSATIITRESIPSNRLSSPIEELNENSNELPIFESESISGISISKWKVTIPIIIVLIILGLFLMQKDSTEKNTAQNITSTSSPQELNSSMLTGSINDALPSMGQQ